ncbi:MAG: hypothetical protein HKN03_03255 [Acidimicrobiales bacterium]|nr:hypothetical protein [Acidimicrobiales bacterium]
MVCGIGQLHPLVPLRPAADVMRLERMGSFYPTRLSFMRRILRDLAEYGARVDRVRWEIDDLGFGRAVYCVEVASRAYSLVAFSTPLDPLQRTDRVIAEAWDSSYVLYDGVPSDAELDRLEKAVPRQEAARYAVTDLVLSRANRSVRLFDHVVDRLAKGQQPAPELISSIGYLMRTTAVYGNGKFGIADRSVVVDRPIMDGPFGVELLTVWLVRAFTHDLVEHIAARRSPGTAVSLDLRLKRHLGIGNSTGLGMAPFLVTHPVLINNWMLARETALARVRAIDEAATSQHARFFQLLERATKHVAQWETADQEQAARIEALRNELLVVRAVADEVISWSHPWDRLVERSRSWSVECSELLVALLLELYPELVDGLANCMSAVEIARVDPRMTVEELLSIIDAEFGWAVGLDFDQPEHCRLFWYVSEEKQEPRLGDRFAEPGDHLETPLDVGRRVNRLAADLRSFDPSALAGEVCLAFPQHRMAIQRVQTVARHPYSEIRDNVIGVHCRPIDLLRCKLSFFGASKFDPKSDRWTRVTLFQGAPLIDELALDGIDDWWLPVLAEP